MNSLIAGIGRFSRSLYARIALVYLASLVLLSVATAWIAVSHFDRLSHEMQQRMQIGLAANLARVMQEPLKQGPESGVVRQAAQLILSINPSLSLFLLDAQGNVVGNYTGAECAPNTHIDVGALNRLLGEKPMLPIFVAAPCSQQASVFSVARIRYGRDRRPGYLLVLLEAESDMSMSSMLRSSSIIRTLIVAGFLALLVSGAAGLMLFALLTRRFSSLTNAVQRFAEGDYRQRIAPGRNDEIGQLIRAFNNMAGTIEAQLNALRETDRQRRELVAGLSHDFRTPLTSLRGYAEQLQTDAYLSRHTRQAHLDAILANAERLTQLATQLSTLARVDAYESPLRMEPFSLAELAYDVAGKFEPQARAAGVKLTVHCSPRRITVTADIALIDRALANLLDNALRVTAVNGQVKLTIAVEGGNAIINVADTGIGISAEEIPLVTQRFYRTAKGRERSEGSGLGLAIVQEICERHDTRLVIQSKPGHGTQMQFKLAFEVAS